MCHSYLSLVNKYSKLQVNIFNETLKISWLQIFRALKLVSIFTVAQAAWYASSLSLKYLNNREFGQKKAFRVLAHLEKFSI